MPFSVTHRHRMESTTDGSRVASGWEQGSLGGEGPHGETNQGPETQPADLGGCPWCGWGEWVGTRDEGRSRDRTTEVGRPGRTRQIHGKQGVRMLSVPVLSGDPHCALGVGPLPGPLPAPITTLTCAGHPEAFEAKTKDLHSPELGQTPPPTEATGCSAWRGWSPRYQGNKTEKHT